MGSALPLKAWSSVAVVLALGAASAPLACGPQRAAPTADAGMDATALQPSLTRDQLLDPQTCLGCHQAHYADWSRSVHAHASDDPIFIAMNKRGQRETGGQLGDFCVKCHAPMAVHEGKTTDGLNLANVDPKYKGVTCFFCHSVASVTGTHNAALSLSDDLVMRGEYANPIPNTGHASAPSSLFSRDSQDSAKMCGACHDIIVNQTNAFIERTFCEWSHSAFNAPYSSGGQSCVTCHMVESNGAIAQFPNAPVRTYHEHDWPGVDIPLDAKDNVEKMAVQQFLASTFQGALCVTQAGGVRVILDPVLTGHDWPSGAAQDRRAWAEVVAYAGDNIIYQSGMVPDGTRIVAVQNDPDLWLLREQMYDLQQNPVSMFWQAANTKGNAIPALPTYDQLDPGFYRTHVEQLYPRDGGVAPLLLPQQPDRVTVRMRLQPVGLDVLDDLVDGGDLDPTVTGQMPTYDVSFLAPDGGITPMLEWTPQAAASAAAQNAALRYQDKYDQTFASCVSTANFNAGATKMRAPAFAPPADCPMAGDAGVDDATNGGDDAASDAGAEADGDAEAVCDPRYTPDTIAPGLTKTGSSGALSFVLMSADAVPPVVGYNTWVVKVIDTQGKPVTDATFTNIKTYMPLHGHPGSIVPTWTSNGDGTYTIKLYLFMPGVWQITPTVKTSTTTDSAIFAFCAGG
jgi:hypothetical protein